MPFWSDRAYAKQCAKEDWSHYEPTPIPLKLFLEGWLTGMAADGCLVGTNWNAQLCGHEIEPSELRQEIEIVCDLYARPAVEAALKKFVESTDAQPYLP